MFRQRPKNILFPEAKKRNVGIIARVPLASGLLSGKFTKAHVFSHQVTIGLNMGGVNLFLMTLTGTAYVAKCSAVLIIRMDLQPLRK